MRITFTWLTLLLLLAAHTVLSQQPKPTASPSPEAQDRIYTVKEVDVKAKVKGLPEPEPPGRDCFEFDYPRDVTLKVVLRKSGVVTDVTLVKKSGCSWDKNAVQAARKIEFQPAKKNGEAVSQYLTVHYAYQKP